jgi:hypothetical protein
MHGPPPDPLVEAYQVIPSSEQFVEKSDAGLDHDPNFVSRAEPQGLELPRAS